MSNPTSAEGEASSRGTLSEPTVGGGTSSAPHPNPEAIGASSSERTSERMSSQPLEALSAERNRVEETEEETLERNIEIGAMLDRLLEIEAATKARRDERVAMPGSEEPTELTEQNVESLIGRESYAAKEEHKSGAQPTKRGRDEPAVEFPLSSAAARGGSIRSLPTIGTLGGRSESEHPAASTTSSPTRKKIAGAARRGLGFRKGIAAGVKFTIEEGESWKEAVERLARDNVAALETKLGTLNEATKLASEASAEVTKV